MIPNYKLFVDNILFSLLSLRHHLNLGDTLVILNKYITVLIDAT